MDQHIQDSIIKYQNLKIQVEGLKQYLIGAGVSESELDNERTNNHKNKEPKVGSGIAKKDKTNWDDYSRLVLRELGSKGKASAAIDYAHAANPKIPIKKVTDNMRSALFRQGKDGILLVEHGASRIEGNTYILKMDDEVLKIK